MPIEGFGSVVRQSSLERSNQPRALAAGGQAELDRVSQTLTGGLRELAERYASPLPQLAGEVEALAAKAAGHLRKMGVVWL
jgi:type I restriction enzyme M protein